MDFLPYIVSGAIGALLMGLAFPVLMKYHADRKPRAAKEAVKAVDRLIAVLGKDDGDEDDAKRRKNELDLQLSKLADRTSDLHNKAG